MVPKREYILRDAMRKAHRQGRACSPPATHPFNPLLALRMCSLPQLTDQQRLVLVEGMLDAAWCGQKANDEIVMEMSSPEVLAKIADSVGLEGRALVLMGQTSDAAKDALRRQTDDAIQLGVFGVPTIICDREEEGVTSVGNNLFFGSESVDFIEAHLEGDDPCDGETVDRWLKIPYSAQRRR